MLNYFLLLCSALNLIVVVNIFILSTSFFQYMAVTWVFLRYLTLKSSELSSCSSLFQSRGYIQVLFSCFSLFWSRGNRQNFLFLHSVLQTQNFAFSLSKSFGILSSLFSPHSPWQTSRLAFAFSQAYIFHVWVSFFTSNLNSQHSASALSTTDFFFTFCSKK